MATQPYGRKTPEQWWKDFLDSTSWRSLESKSENKPLVVMDVFSSVGGLSLGAKAAGKLFRRPVHVALAVDQDAEAVRVHQANLGTDRIYTGSVRDLVDWAPGRDSESRKKKFQFADALMPELLDGQEVELLLGGPPCQGHSTLNNKTRSDDAKNELMIEMAALAVAYDIPNIVVENVPNALNDARGAILDTTEYLESAGYHVYPIVVNDDGGRRNKVEIVRAIELGWPQTRKRFFLIASREPTIDGFYLAVDALRMTHDPNSHGLPVTWAISGLEDEPGTYPDDITRTTPVLSDDNRRRMDYLFTEGEDSEEGLFDLDNHMRPVSHQDGHTYPAVYGRMHPDQPAPTITGGFMTPGRGRFIHPTRKRVLTPHEAARVQGFPDWFDFGAGLGRPPTRTELAKWIGDAVPSIMGATAVSALMFPTQL